MYFRSKRGEITMIIVTNASNAYKLLSLIYQPWYLIHIPMTLTYRATRV